MDSENVLQFQKKYEVLSGHVHLAARVSDLAAATLEIVRGAGATRVALGELPDSVARAVEQACVEAGIEVLKPPYENRSLPHAIDGAQVGISWAAFAVAESGSLVELTTLDAVRLVSTLPRVHIGIVSAADVLPTLKSAAAPLRKFYEENRENATATFISGPSRTADIEMRLTLGVHGPEVAHAIVLSEQESI